MPEIWFLPPLRASPEGVASQFVKMTQSQRYVEAALSPIKVCGSFWRRTSSGVRWHLPKSLGFADEESEM